MKLTIFWQNIVKGFEKLKYLTLLQLSSFLSHKSLLGDAKVVVCLTSFGKRIDGVFYTLESIGRGEVKPFRLILWLDDENIIQNLPANLKRLQKRGLEIKHTKDYGPHKKYYPYVCECFNAQLPLVTADDDIFYPKFWLKGLLNAYEQDATVVSCYRAQVVTLKDNMKSIGDFYTWAMCSSTIPSYLNHATGCSGVIYPPKLQKILAEQGEDFEHKCPKGDDIWLHVNAIRNGFKIKQIYKEDLNFRAIPLSQKTGLKWENASGKNDIQAKLTYTDADIDILKKEILINS